MITKILFCVVLSLLYPTTAYAYLDPGTGSYIYQLILGFILGGLLSVKLLWKKIKYFVSKLISKPQKGINN